MANFVRMWRQQYIGFMCTLYSEFGIKRCLHKSSFHCMEIMTGLNFGGNQYKRMCHSFGVVLDVNLLETKSTSTSASIEDKSTWNIMQPPSS